MKINPDQEKAVDFYDQNYAGIDPLYVEPGRRMFLGDSQNRSCRFCNKKSPDVSFRKKAHAIPELLGNSSLFSDYECDDCNTFFGSTIENDLGNWTKPSRTFARIRGKSGVPAIKKVGNVEGWRIDYDVSGFHIKQYESDPFIEIDETEKRLRLELRRDVFTPVAVLKAFVKIGMTIFPPEELANFRTALNWIRNPNHDKALVAECPVIHTFQPGPMRNDLIVLMLMRRRREVSDVPYAFMVFGYGNDVFQVFLPSPEQDKGIDGKRLTFPAYPTPGGVDPQRYGTARVRVLNLCGRQPVKGETMSIALGFESIEVMG